MRGTKKRRDDTESMARKREREREREAGREGGRGVRGRECHPVCTRAVK